MLAKIHILFQYIFKRHPWIINGIKLDRNIVLETHIQKWLEKISQPHGGHFEGGDKFASVFYDKGKYKNKSTLTPPELFSMCH